MLEAYSTNIEVAQNSAIPFNNVSIEKGCTTSLNAPGTVFLNKKGVYMVSVDAAAAPSEAGIVSIQLYKDGTPQPQAQSAVTGTTSTVDNISFVTLVQAKEDNTCNCCTTPTTIKVMNTGEDSTFTVANICVTKIC